MEKTVRHVTLSGLAALVMTMLSGCESARAATNKQAVVALFSGGRQVYYAEVENYDILKQDTLYCEKNGKQILIHGTYVLQEK